MSRTCSVRNNHSVPPRCAPNTPVGSDGVAPVSQLEARPRVGRRHCTSKPLAKTPSDPGQPQSPSAALLGLTVAHCTACRSSDRPRRSRVCAVVLSRAEDCTGGGEKHRGRRSRCLVPEEGTHRQNINGVVSLPTLELDYFLTPAVINSFLNTLWHGLRRSGT